MAERHSFRAASVALMASLISVVFIVPPSGSAAPSDCDGPLSAGRRLSQRIAGGAPAPPLEAGCVYSFSETVSVTGQLTIEANGATLRGTATPLFTVAPNAALALDEATVVHDGGGRAIVNHGFLRVTVSTFSGDLGGGAGGITTDRYARITGSTFVGNTSSSRGGAIENLPDGNLHVEDSTFSANHSSVEGGAIFNGGRLVLSNTTLWGNSAHDGSGLANGGLAIVNNTIIADGNQGGALCSDSVDPTGSNNVLDRVGGGECGTSFDHVGDLRLGPLEDNGGPTRTHAPLPGSRVIDAGDNAACTDADQRGVARPGTQEDSCDVGAVEVVQDLVPTNPNDAPSASDAARAIDANAAEVQIDLGALTSDEETGQADLVYELERAPELGTASLSGSTVTYDVDLDAYGTDSFTYRVTDRVEPGCSPVPACVAKSAAGTITITIRPPPPPPVPPNPDPPIPGPIKTSPAPDPSPSPSPSPSPLPADLSLESVTLELGPEGGSADSERAPVYAAGAGPIVIAASGDSLHVQATVVNNGGTDSPPTSMDIETDSWVGEQIAIPGIAAGSKTVVDEWMPAPPGATDETRFRLAVAPVSGEGDADNNAAPELLAVQRGDGGSKKVVVIVVIGLVGAAGAVLASTSMVRARRVRTRRSHRRKPPIAFHTSGLPELVDAYLGAEVGPQLWAAGAASKRLREELEDDDLVGPLISTVYWRALLETDGFRRVLRSSGASSTSLVRPEVLIVSHAEGTRHDLVLLDPEFSLSEPSSVAVDVSPEELAEAWQRTLVTSGFKRGARVPGTKFPMSLLTKVLREVSRDCGFGLVVAPKPEVVLTNSPSPAWPVAAEGEEPTSSVGVVVIDGEGRTGVTVADHAVRGRERVMVNGHLGTIVSSDPISDSSFVEVEVGDIETSRGHKGPLSGMSPRQMEVAEFDGMRSGPTTTRVVGWDPTILTMESYIQNKIVTDPVTMPGDSGAALIDGEGHILGFAFYTTGLNSQPAHSGWIWAESVYRAHGLRSTVGAHALTPAT